MRPSEICVSCTLEQEHFHQGKTLKLCTCRPSVRLEINHDGLHCLVALTSCPSGFFAHFCSVLSDFKPTAKQSASIDISQKNERRANLALFPDCTGCQAMIKSWPGLANTPQK